MTQEFIFQSKSTSDLGSPDDPNVRYRMVWQTLGPNNDKALPEPWPDPTMLQVIKSVNTGPASVPAVNQSTPSPSWNRIPDGILFTMSPFQKFNPVEMTVEIVSSSGNTIHTISNSNHNSFHWDLTDGSGNPVPSGIYIYRIRITPERNTSAATGAVPVFFH